MSTIEDVLLEEESISDKERIVLGREETSWNTDETDDENSSGRSKYF